MSPPSSVSKRKPSHKKAEAGGKRSTVGFLLGLLFDREDGADNFIRKVGFSPSYMALTAKKPTLFSHSSENLISKIQATIFLNVFSFLMIQRSRVRFPALPHFLRSSGSGTGSTQPREDN
jgi:hypothetical protein